MAKAKGKTKTKTKAKSTAKRKVKVNSAFMRPWTPDKWLSQIVGEKAIPRTEVTKKLWIYIKKHDLQDPKKRQYILADSKLKPVFGGKKRVSMFEMTKWVGKHLK